MAEPKFKVGDAVNTDRYDDTERLPNRIGGGVVMAVDDFTRCESGWMVQIRTKQGWEVRLDQNWITHEQPALPL